MVTDRSPKYMYAHMHVHVPVHVHTHICRAIMDTSHTYTCIAIVDRAAPKDLAMSCSTHSTAVGDVTSLHTQIPPPLNHWTQPKLVPTTHIVCRGLQ